MISYDEAIEAIQNQVLPTEATETLLRRSVGKVLRQSIVSDIASPPHRKSVMDGFAVRSDDINQGQRRLQVIETIVAGGWPEKPLQPGEASRIMTGAPLPEGADAVVMVELTETESVDGTEWVTLQIETIERGKHTLDRAAHFSEGDLIFRAGHRVRPSDVGLLAEVGASQFLTARPPTVAVLPTGDELVACDTQPQRGQIRNSNGPMLAALTEQLGLPTTELEIGPDRSSDLASAVEKGLEHDLLILSGGVSAGIRDLVPAILKQQGVNQVFHQVAIKPGKPIWFGVYPTSGERRCYVFGLPGNPISSLVGFHLFVRTAIRCMEGATKTEPLPWKSLLAKQHQTRGNRTTFWPGRWVVADSSERLVEPVDWKGSSDLRSLRSADGLIRFSPDHHDHQPGEEVAFYPW